MYCIDGGRTLKNCKPALIHEPLNRVKTKNAKSISGALSAALANAKVKFTEVSGSFIGSNASALSYAIA